MNSKCRRTVLKAMAIGPALTVSFRPNASLAVEKHDTSEPIAQPPEQSPEQYIRRARDLAEISVQNGDGTGYGAVLVKNRLIVGEGRNRVYALNDPTAHSEIDAIRDACRRLIMPSLKGCEIYCSARPCQMCETACYWARLTRIYFPSSNSKTTSLVPRYSNC